MPSHSSLVAMASILVSEADPGVRRLPIVLMKRLGHEAIALDRHVEVPPRADLLSFEPSFLGAPKRHIAGACSAVALREAVC
jgi:hypothetical protein